MKSFELNTQADILRFKHICKLAGLIGAYITDIPDSIVRPNDPFYHEYKCRVNYIQAYVAEMDNVIGLNILSEGTQEVCTEALNAVLKYASTKGFVTKPIMIDLMDASMIIAYQDLLRDGEEEHLAEIVYINAAQIIEA